MNTIFMKTTVANPQIAHHSTKEHRVLPIAEHSTKANEDRIWQVNSDVLTVNELEAMFVPKWGSIINKVTAYIEAKILQPNRVIDEGGENETNYSLDNKFPLSLADSKLQRCNDIDKRTSELIAIGYTYDTKNFSISPNARDKYNMILDKYKRGRYTESGGHVKISTIDNRRYELDYDFIETFCDGLQDFVEGYLEHGTDLKETINETATDSVQKVHDVVDPR